MACVQYQASKTVKWLRELAGFQSSSGSSSANSAFDWVAIVHDVVPIPAAFFALCILWTIIQHRFCSARPGPGTSADSHANEEIRNDALLSGDAVKQPQTNNNNNSNRIHYGHPFLSAPAAYPGEKSTASRQNVRKSKHVTPWKENVVYNSDEDVEMKLLGGADRKPQLSSTRKNKKDGKRRNNQHVKECEENVVIVPQSASLQASRQNTTTVWSTMESQQSPSHTEDINGNEQKGNKAHSCSARFWFFLTWTFVLSVLYLVVTVQLVSTLESTSSLLDGVADQRETLLSAVRSVLLGISDILSVISDVCYQINDEFDDIASKLPVSPNTLTTINDYLESLPVDRLRQGLQATCTAINAAAPLLILANFAAICGLVISKQSERQSSQWFAFQFARAVAIITVCVSTMALVVAVSSIKHRNVVGKFILMSLECSLCRCCWGDVAVKLSQCSSTNLRLL